MLAMAGAPGRVGQRTIGAAKAIDRYQAFSARIRSLVPQLRELLDVRNGVVHLGTAVPPTFDAAFGAYLRAVELVAEDLGVDEEAFWGPELAPVVAARRSGRAKTIESETANKIAVAAA